MGIRAGIDFPVVLRPVGLLLMNQVTTRMGWSILTTVVLATCTQVAWADIAAKAAEARALMQQFPQAQSYFVQAFVPQLTSAMRKCAPPGTKLPDNATWQLVLVGYISADGKWAEGEHSPDNPITSCLAREVGSTRFPAPPAALMKKAGFPIVVEMTIRP